MPWGTFWTPLCWSKVTGGDLAQDLPGLLPQGSLPGGGVHTAWDSGFLLFGQGIRGPSTEAGTGAPGSVSPVGDGQAGGVAWGPPKAWKPRQVGTYCFVLGLQYQTKPRQKVPV